MGAGERERERETVRTKRCKSFECMYVFVFYSQGPGKDMPLKLCTHVG